VIGTSGVLAIGSSAGPEPQGRLAYRVPAEAGEEERMMKTKIRPLGDRILVRRLDEQKEQKTSAGIIIPDTAKEKPMEARVEAIGPGRRTDDGKLQKLEVKVGDRVLIGKYSGTDVKIEGDEFVIMREDDVLGVIEA
jgi:chaperonin GroES